MSTLLLNIVILAGLLGLGGMFLVLEYRALRGARGAWKAAALAPAMVVGWIVLGIVVNPPAHSLWPIEIIVWLIPAVVALLFVRLVQSVRGHAHALTDV
jgi:hypothetical protein